MSLQNTRHKIFNTFQNAPKTCVYSLMLFIAAIIILCGNDATNAYPIICAFSAFVFFYGLLYFFSGKAIFALSTSSVFVIVLQFVNQLKIHHYKQRLMFADLYIMLDPSNTETLLHYPLTGLAFISLLLLMIITTIVSWRAVPRRMGYFPQIIGLCMMLTTGLVLTRCVIHYQPVWRNTLWAGGTGVVSNLVMSSRAAHYTAPSFSEETSSYFKTHAATLNRSQPNIDSKKPDIVLLLQESTTDPRLYQLPNPMLLPHLTMFEQDSNVKAHSLMRVHTFGGGTWLSEFTALTGLPSDDFGAMKNSVFYSVVDHLSDSLFKQMKDNGYYTVVLTPFNKSAYNANHAYKIMGADKIIQPQELGYPGKLQENLWHIPTADILNYVKQILTAQTDKPLFVYALTMYEHGPYDAHHKDDYQLNNYVKNKNSAGKFSHYVEKIKTSDPALVDFFQFVDQRQKPTLFMYFVDHQPALDWENGYTTTLPDAAYLTQFSLRDNIDTPTVSDLGQMTDIAFLGGILLEHAQLKISPFYQANIDMRHPCKGEMKDCADKKLFESYRNYIYNELNAASVP
ncbi:sulfatase domain-containing hypothetical protein [Candidatus Regiella insecticola]|uniref:Sulfatase N-terminal domain-containing protein n=2 Tax=Candidatus Regiella insecticola TaxID=138073 RepID=A0A6L2ZSE9_9ENTR|nr:sulfatase domain-containing hypothetical protein [Candidatus Regiella insecticola]